MGFGARLSCRQVMASSSFHSAAAAWQGNHGLRHLCQGEFALVHIGSGDDAGEAVVVPTVIHHELWNNANGFAASVEHSIAHGAHQPLAACTVEACPSALRHERAQLVGRINVVLLQVTT